MRSVYKVELWKVWQLELEGIQGGVEIGLRALQAESMKVFVCSRYRHQGYP